MTRLAQLPGRTGFRPRLPACGSRERGPAARGDSRL